MSEPTTEAMGFKYVNLSEIDPNFTPVDPGFYNLRVAKAELRTYIRQKDGKSGVAGTEGEFVNFRFTITGHDRFSGRTLFESLFPSEFTFKILRRIQDNSGVQQTGSLEDWLKELNAVQPVIKLMVDLIPDVYGNGTANPKTVKPDGTPSMKNAVNWRGGVSQGDVT